MALIVEDGTAKVDSQTYATVAELRAYAALRASTVPAADAECEVLLVKAMDYLHGQDFIGERRTKEQALDWPRYDAVIEWWPVNDNEIPRQLIQAQCALAIEAQTVDLLPTLPVGQKGVVISESVAGAVSVAYANPERVRNMPAMAKAMALLRLLLRNRGMYAVRT
jgi:hypothetical protein